MLRSIETVGAGIVGSRVRICDQDQDSIRVSQREITAVDHEEYWIELQKTYAAADEKRYHAPGTYEAEFARSRGAIIMSRRALTSFLS